MIAENLPYFNEQDESFTNRRLSDLLPVEFIHQIGLDPNQYIFDQINFSSFFQRRNTDPGFSFIYSNKSSQKRNISIDTIPNSVNAPNIWFSVELSDRTVKAFVSSHIFVDNCEGVIVLDGLILRYGKIIKRIYPTASEVNNYSLRIISFDESGMLYDYLSAQKQLAMILVPKLIKKNNIQTDLIDIETASYQSRALLRVKVSDAHANHMDILTKSLVDLFYIAVEIFSE